MDLVSPYMDVSINTKQLMATQSIRNSWILNKALMWLLHSMVLQNYLTCIRIPIPIGSLTLGILLVYGVIFFK